MNILKTTLLDRGLVMIVYALITLVTGIQVMLNRSIGTGVAALLASALCLGASSTIASCFLARHEQHYSPKDLGGIAAISAALTLIGFAVMRWGGFRLFLYGIEISGFQWALVGSVVGLITANRELLK